MGLLEILKARRNEATQYLKQAESQFYAAQGAVQALNMVVAEAEAEEAKENEPSEEELHPDQPADLFPQEKD